MAKKKTDPVKGKKKKQDSTRKGSQQLSDRLAKRVSGGKMTYDDARKVQRHEDSIASKTSRVGRKVSGSSQGLPSKRKYTKAKFKIDNKGNKKAY